MLSYIPAAICGLETDYPMERVKVQSLLMHQDRTFNLPNSLGCAGLKSLYNGTPPAQKKPRKGHNGLHNMAFRFPHMLLCSPLLSLLFRLSSG